MPRNAIENILNVDYVLPADHIGPLLARLSADVVAIESSIPVSPARSAEVAMSALDTKSIDEHPGAPSVYACPECHGALFEIREGRIVRYRCRTGHGYTLAALEEEQAVQADNSLWNAMRTLEEYAAVLMQIAEKSKAEGDQQAAAAKFLSAERAREEAAALRQMIEEGVGGKSNTPNPIPSPPDPGAQ